MHSVRPCPSRSGALTKQHKRTACGGSSKLNLLKRKPFKKPNSHTVLELHLPFVHEFISAHNSLSRGNVAHLTSLAAEGTFNSRCCERWSQQWGWNENIFSSLHHIVSIQAYTLSVLLSVFMWMELSLRCIWKSNRLYCEHLFNGRRISVHKTQ